ncbi:FecR domain-containing protein [Deinococcus aluminii]|uniref:FecR protein domain-containing protein n=1 Tax=Deinococcus aluminii TaxID=1656885 RepID=A0ABP9XBM7_9DEIO
MRATAAPWLPAVRTCLRPLRPVLAALLVTGGTPASAQAAPLKVQQVLGRAEVLLDGGAWRPVSGSTPVRLGLRTGTGRAQLVGGGGDRAGTILVGPTSRLRVFRGEADLQGGQFLLSGPVAVHVLGNHLVLERAAQARVDLGGAGAESRVAVLDGNARLALGKRTLHLGAGQQADLRTGQVTPFTGGDAWYAAQFTGVGSASVQATRGPVYLTSGGDRQIAEVGAILQPGERLNTGSGAWAEVGFAGGGYLRLQAQSELGVRSRERTARGQELTLQLTRGSAWNVVSDGQAAVSAPIQSTAARGSVYQVGPGGLVQVFAGTGTAGGTGIAALGRFNQPLDAERAQPLTLQVDPVPPFLRDLTLSATSLPEARVTARVGLRTFPLTPVNGAPGHFQLNAPAAPLTEGPHTVQVRAEWRGQVRTRTLRVLIDRTPPILSDLRVGGAGSVLLVGGTVRDAATERVTLTAQLGAERFSRTVTLGADTGTFQLTLPAPAPGTPLRLTARDEAGNEVHADLP